MFGILDKNAPKNITLGSSYTKNIMVFLCIRVKGEALGDGDEEMRLIAGSGGEEWGSGTKDRQQTTFSQPEQSYEAAFNKVVVSVRLIPGLVCSSYGFSEAN